MFKLIVALLAASVAVAAPAPAPQGWNPPQLTSLPTNMASRFYCQGDGQADFGNLDELKAKAKDFCVNWYQHWDRNLGPVMDLGNGYSFHIDDSQGGNYAPCTVALEKVINECASKGQVGGWIANANNYEIFKNN